MAGEPILIVDDTPVNLKLTRILLINEGYKVMTASSAEEAIELLKSYHPQLVLADIQLPGMDGFEFTRHVKQNQATRDIVVVALTAFAMKGDEQRASEAGCDGYITKPIDTRSLGQRIRHYLSLRQEAPSGDPTAETPSPIAVAQMPDPEPTPDVQTADPVESAVDPAEMNVLRRGFLAEGYDRARQLLLDVDGVFDTPTAIRVIHQWIGTGGLLGYQVISQRARAVQAVLHEKPLDNALLRESLTDLVMAFSRLRQSLD